MSDEALRARALEVSASFLVQAPAGSGKTALLTQRVLRLLATVEEPEEILAITFTRKAAAEMRGRILEKLRAAQEPRPTDAFEAATWELASRALQRDRERGWQLLASPGRLRVQTIDAFQQSLVQRLPWLSKAGVSVSPTEFVQPLYVDAVREALRYLATDPEGRGADRRALLDLLQFRDNHLEQLSSFLVSLLARRDQWLSLFGADLFRETDMVRLRTMLEANLRREVEGRLAETQRALPAGLDQVLAPLARYAAENLQGQNSPIEALISFSRWPDATAEDLPLWRGLRTLLLTGGGDLRKTVTVQCGFPAGEKVWKPRMVALLKDLNTDGAETLTQALDDVESLPDPRYSESQWRTLEALFRLMRVLAPMLHLQFAKHGETDFTEIALRAATALEEMPGSPTALAERLDAQIRHILVDEFQDTSILQMKLIRALTENWVPGDGRSLFLVGDPMQSIYGWRNARVDLFLRAWEGRLPGLPALENLRLQRNFRSRPRLIAECNEAFATILPQANDAVTGKVALSPALPGREEVDLAPSRIHCEAFLAEDRNPQAEAMWMADEIARLQSTEPKPRIGVLFRKKGQAAALAQVLGERGILYQAVDLERLADLPVTVDLRSLLGALLSTADRLAWWSVLRAPWNGLRLATLERLQRMSEGRTIWHAIERVCEGDAEGLGDADDLLRLQRTRQLFQEAFTWRGRRHIADLVRAMFVGSGASRCYADPRSQVAAGQFFRLLLESDEAVLMSDPAGLDEALGRLLAPSDPKAPDTLQLLTIHKAKGLEFDFVFVPYLNSRAGNHRGGALVWDEAPDQDSGNESGTALLLAPCKAAGEKDPSLAGFIAQRLSAREKEEAKRVLYVAKTRAKERLYLSATIDPSKATDSSKLKKIPQSYLAESAIWQRFEPLFAARLEEYLAARNQAAANAEPEVPGSAAKRYPLLRRVRATELPDVRLAPDEVPALGSEGEAKLYRPGGSWETVETAQGTVFHQVMEMVAGRAELERVAVAGEALRPVVLDALRKLLPAEDDLASAASLVIEGVRRTAVSETGAWIFSDAHRQVFTEQAIAYTEGSLAREARLDRVIQDATGKWHVVDFKLVDAQPADLDRFVSDQQALYRSTLERYGRLWQREFPGTVGLLLYFPLQDASARWTIEPGVRAASPDHG